MLVIPWCRHEFSCGIIFLQPEELPLSFLAVQYTGDKCSLLLFILSQNVFFLLSVWKILLTNTQSWNCFTIQLFKRCDLLSSGLNCSNKKSVVSLSLFPTNNIIVPLKILLFKIFFLLSLVCSNLIMVYLSISFLVIYLASWICGFMFSITSEKNSFMPSIFLCLNLTMTLHLYSNACYRLTIRHLRLFICSTAFNFFLPELQSGQLLLFPLQADWSFPP